MRKILTATAVSLFAIAPAVSFAQADSGSSDASYPASGGAAGAETSQVVGYSVLAGVGAAAAIGAAFAVADSGSNDDDVDTSGSTGTTGTTSTTGTTGTN